MNRLWLRLTLSFLAVIAVMVITVAVLGSTSVGSEFRQYLVQRDALADSGLLDDLARFYGSNGTWDGVNTLLDARFASQGVGQGSGQGMGQGAGRGQMMGRPGIMLADPNGNIIYDSRQARTGSSLSESERVNALPVTAGNQTVGYFVVIAGRGMALADQNFLDRLQRTLVIAALVAGILGLALGLIVSRTVAKPLTDLAHAAEKFAGQDWSQRVTVQGTAETALVGRAFNRMADALQQAEQLRRNLMADIAHELRTPLTVMQGNLHAMLDDIYPLERSELVPIYDETRLLSRLVDDVRELTLADAGQLKLTMQPTDLSTLLKTAVANFSIAAEMQGLAVTLDIPDMLPAVVADPDRLRQVLHNLLANALRHTHQGTISISAMCERSAIGELVKVTVADTGQGIAVDELPHVFDRFYRGKDNKENSNKGSGLGLAIAKTWVTMMGGTISVESTPETGSCFWFTLKVANLDATE
jgi:two-component system OmpR family sensor kinase/two-component system sensor histidine kinase BaeS